MNTSPSVRMATSADAAGIMALCRLLWAENGLFKMDDGLVLAKLNSAFNRQGGIIGVIGEGDQLKGCIFLELSKFWYTNDWHLSEIFNFVHPDHRQSDCAVQLVNFGKKTSEGLGLPLLIGIITTDRTESKVRLYRRSLGSPAGAFFLHNANWPQQKAAQSFWDKPLDVVARNERGGKRARSRRLRARNGGPEGMNSHGV